MNREPMNRDTPEKTGPAHEVKVGPVRATAWANETDGRVWHTVRFSRRYRDREGNWQDGNSFSRDDLPLVVKAAQDLWAWMYQRPGEGADDAG